MVISYIVFIIENEYRSIINYSNNIVITFKQKLFRSGYIHRQV